MSDLTGKVAVVTGGNSGIGLATAQEFRARGAAVAISGRNAQAVDEAARRLGDDVLGVTADVQDVTALERLFETVEQKLGKVDILFVNAGIAKMGALADVSQDDFDEVMGVNFKGAFFTVQRPYLCSMTTPRSS
jgi:NAD(P)-dependent dehydrogenase (short-subunit alcohol dehydrogenase family)